MTVIKDILLAFLPIAGLYSFVTVFVLLYFWYKGLMTTVQEVVVAYFLWWALAGFWIVEQAGILWDNIAEMKIPQPKDKDNE